MAQIGITLKIKPLLPLEYVSIMIKRIDKSLCIGDWVKLKHYAIDFSDLPPVPIVDTFEVFQSRELWRKVHRVKYYGIVIPREFKPRFKKLIKSDNARRGQPRSQAHREMIQKHEKEHKKYFIGLQDYLLEKAHPMEVLANVEHYS